jgi:hypothetical protein
MPDRPMTVEEIERKMLVLWTSCWPHASAQHVASF